MHGHSRMIRRLTLGCAAAAIVFAGAGMLSPRSQAGIPSPWEVHKRIHKHVEKRVEQLIDLPRRIHRDHVRAFHSFFSGRTYYAPHHHFHTVYRFPVVVGPRVVYRPYTYCNDGLFIGSSVALPRLSVSVYPGAPIYYGPPPVAYAPAPRYYEDRDDRRYDHRYDRDRDDDHGHHGRWHDDHGDWDE